MMMRAHQNRTMPWKPLNLAWSDRWWMSTWAICLSIYVVMGWRVWNAGVMASAEVAATDRDDRPGDVGGLVRGQEEDRGDLLVDRAVAVHQAGVDGLVDDALVPLGFLRGGRLGVARDAPG